MVFTILVKYGKVLLIIYILLIYLAELI